MNKKNFIYCYNDHVLTLILIILSLCLVILGILGLVVLNEEPILCYGCIILGLVMFVCSLRHLVWSYRTKIVFDDTEIKYYLNGKIVKSIPYNEIQAINVFIITRLGEKIRKIVINNGTFNYNGGDPYFILSLKKIEHESWIAIQYSWKRLQMIKAILPNCPIEEIDSTGWND